MKRFVESLVSHTVLANVVLISIVVAAILAVKSMRRESMPEFSFDMIQVVIPYPGAEPQEVEEGINRRMEAAMDGLVGVKEYHTFSREGVAYTTIEVADDQDLEEMKDRIRSAVDAIPTLPVGAEEPRIVELKEEEEVINIALWGDLPERQLKEWAERIRADLQQLPAISQVVVADTRDYEITVEVSRERLLQHNLTMEEVGRAIRRGSRNYSSGSIRASSEEISIRTIGKRYDGRDFEDVVIRATPNGNVVRLNDIATVRDGFTEYPAYGRFNGKPSVLLEMYKVDGEDSIAISDAVYAYTREKESTLPEGLHMSPCFDESEFIRSQISMLLENGLMGLVLVLVILWLFLSSKLSFWVSMGIPISVGGALIVMWIMDSTINQISLMAFIIVLGIIVDDAIVVGESIVYHRKRGLGPMEAAMAGVSEVGLPVIAAVLTTIVAFLPGLFVPGFMGKIVALLPVVVVAALLVSLVECLFLLPAHLNNLPAQEEEKTGNSPPQRLQAFMRESLQLLASRIYAPLVKRAVTHRYVTACFALSALFVTAGLIGGNYLRIVMWPPADGNHLAAFVEFPVGTPSEVTRDALARMEKALGRVADEMPTKSGDPLLRNVHSRVFQGLPHRGRMFVEMPAPSKRGIHAQDISTAWEKEVGVIPGAVEQSYYKSSIGNDGSPINIWLQGRDMEALREAAELLKGKLRSFEGVYQVEDTFRPGKNELQVRLKPEAHAAGLSLDDVSSFLRAGYYGEEALRFQRGRDDVKVRVRYPQIERKTLSELEETLITTPAGHKVPLVSVAEFDVTQGYAAISGSNGLRRLAIFAEVDTNITTGGQVVGALEEEYLDTLVAGFADMRWSVHGAAQSDAEALDGLLRGFAMAVMVIFVIMATVFRSYLQPFVILLIIPFGIVGAAIGHLFMGIPMTFLSLFGIVALSGVVVNDAIVLIECVNGMLAKGMPFFQAVTEGGVRRFRAIFLTTASTSVGLAPLLLEKDLEAQIVIPMATSIAFGVVFATVLTLLLIPALLAILNDGRRITHRLLKGQWPTPEAVEPAVLRGNRASDHVPVVVTNPVTT
jgi:multidrug efflux pump subunit AcrB